MKLLKHLIVTTTHNGVICEVAHNRIIVLIERCTPDQDNHINKVGTCGSCGNCTNKDKFYKMILKAGQGERYSVNDKISVRLCTVNSAVASIVLFGVPLILIILNLIFWNVTRSASSNSIWPLVGTIVCCTIGFCFSAAINYAFQKRYPPVILHKQQLLTTDK